MWIKIADCLINLELVRKIEITKEKEFKAGEEEKYSIRFHFSFSDSTSPVFTSVGGYSLEEVKETIQYLSLLLNPIDVRHEVEIIRKKLKGSS